MCVCGGGHPQTFVKRWAEIDSWKIKFREKFGWVKWVKIPFLYWLPFNLRIAAEDGRLYHTWPECASDSGILKRI